MDCITKGDSVIHEYILDFADLEQLKEVKIGGKNKDIRNFAAEKIRRMTKQKNSR